MKAMKAKRGDFYNKRTQYFEYTLNGTVHWVQGELYYNRKRKRYEHVHEGPRGGETLIFWSEKESV